MRILKVFLLIGIPFVSGEFGILNKKGGDKRKLEETLQEASIDANGNVDAKFQTLARELQSVAPISSEDALNVAVILDAAKLDPETSALLARMPEDTLKGLKDSLTPIEVVQGLKQSLDELKAIEILFLNPERAVLEMEKEGMLERNRVDFYKKNPHALAEDTRKGVYFTFLSLAAAGGYL